ncbi:MAG TPA: hypothetical protein VGH52_06780 [Gaiellaceae bacterium]|jgi:hypothetical protein
MATTRVRHDLLAADGFDVVGFDESLGTVDEFWLGEDGEPSALVVRLADGARALLEVRDVLGVDLDARQVMASTGAHLLRLDTPPEPADGPGPSPPLWKMPVLRGIVLMFGTITFIVCTLIALDFLFAFLVGGGPPY